MTVRVLWSSSLYRVGVGAVSLRFAARRGRNSIWRGRVEEEVEAAVVVEVVVVVAALLLCGVARRGAV